MARPLSKKIEARQKHVLGPDYSNILDNWREQEADEVGYEYYLKAGFKPEFYGTRIKDKGSQEYNQCEDILSKLREGQQVTIERGNESHPSECWRAYNIQFLETIKHKNDYSSLLSKATIVELFPGELDRVKVYIP